MRIGKEQKKLRKEYRERVRQRRRYLKALLRESTLLQQKKMQLLQRRTSTGELAGGI